jgi:hypothetical protein
MAKCPYAAHRLVLTSAGYCQRCAGDLRLYAAIRWLPEILFNDAHRLAQAGDHNAALLLLTRAMSLRSDFTEARILAAFIEDRPRATEAGLQSCEPAPCSEVPDSPTEALALSETADHVNGEKAAGAITQLLFGPQVPPESSDASAPGERQARRIGSAMQQAPLLQNEGS